MIDPIIITGCARSGTSMSAGIINICGAFGGNMFGPNKYNQKGMFENCDIRQTVSKPYLRKIGVDPMGQKPLPNSRQVFEVSQAEAAKWRAKIQRIIKRHGYTGESGAPWFYKGAKCCLIWYMWHMAFPGAKWVIVRRNAKDIANSCMRTAFMRAYRNEAGWLRWVDIHRQRFAEMHQAGLNIFEFWPSRVIDGDYSHARDMVKSLGLEYNAEMVQTFIDPKLYRVSDGTS